MHKSDIYKGLTTEVTKLSKFLNFFARHLSCKFNVQFAVAESKYNFGFLLTLMILTTHHGSARAAISGYRLHNHSHAHVILTHATKFLGYN